ncbi:tripartite motif-containing protein 16-like protein isoform X2 [Puntigrus tetrazona]|uniref:tripartite motif-containing protein 16-like protein isoform X2 n=1 Tax=Puntigrus tetrazona TaxID=1606681 RepID=UPI001C8A1DDE|nr:tripartite motif-containing protein 16-like protein isoform X2 [Puntigrus tetrazona]
MAEARFSQEDFMCLVCLDVLKDPVTIPCGHSFCMGCITDCWDQQDQMRAYSCPQCRQTFIPIPALSKNNLLAKAVEKLKKRSAHSYAEPGDVQCDVCAERKHKAVKSCLMCLESYCQTHFDHHEEFHSHKCHKVIDATGQLHEKICCQHDKLLEFFCKTDQQFICVICTMYEHKKHNTVSAATQWMEKQQLKETRRRFQQRIQQREKDLQQLKDAMKSHKDSAQTAVEDSERIFTELISSIEKRRSEFTQMIRDQEKAAVSRAEEQLERLEQEINDLRRRDAKLEKLLQTQDHIHLLQSVQCLSAPPESTEVPNILFGSLFSFDSIRESLSQLRGKLEDFWKKELRNRVTFTDVVPRTRNDFLQYSHHITLDPNTAHKRLYLSKRNRVITNIHTEQPYPDHPDRFGFWLQVLGKESVSGRCYWEVEWNGMYGVYISVSYKSIRRKEEDYNSWFGHNDQSWSLYCCPFRFSFIHNKIETDLPVASSRRVGVFVDESAGILSFYSISDTTSLIHTVQTTFTQPLYPGFWVYYDYSSVKLC